LGARKDTAWGGGLKVFYGSQGYYVARGSRVSGEASARSVIH